MRKYKKAAGLLAVSLVISMCSGCVMDREKSSESQAGETANLTDEDAEIKKAAKQDINEIHLRDKDTLYENDDETSVGQQVYLSNQYGQPFPVKVTAKDEKTITFDANHEMAGKELNFKIELVEVK